MSVNQDIWPDVAIHPGENLADIIEERGMNHGQIATSIGSAPQHISDIIRGEENIDSDVATRLEEALGLPAQFWINLQTLYDETLARLEEENETRIGTPATKGVPS